MRCGQFTTIRRIITASFPRQLTRYGGGTMERYRLEQIESYVINFFQERGQSRILARELFDSRTEYANADIVRALEDLEKKERLLVRHTTEGNDYISLTTAGVRSEEHTSE